MAQIPQGPQARAEPAVVAPPPKPANAAAVADADLPKLRLPRTFVPASYAATLSIDPTRDTFDGVIAITGEVKDRTPVIWLHGKDLAIKRASAQQAAPLPISITPRGADLLELRGAFEPGTLVVTIEYTGKLDPVNTAGAFKQTYRGSTYVYTQLEALYARRVFPCFDEPDSKVRT